ncbi:MAG TPA: gluconeogenesis factor YvcK family protein [Anaerolineaceae bacterium]|nr:gluconeogenesis factor YvcK family protein [Anaerolineaceae bacterium]
MTPETRSNWLKRLMSRLRLESRWLAPGTGYKRWLGLTIIGAMLLGLGLAVVILDYYRSTGSELLTPILAVLSLRFLDRPIRFLLFGGLGLILILIGIWGANRALLKPFETGGKPVWDTLQNYRQREKGIKVVVIGGGHGLAALLRGIKAYTHNITAIVTVADDGGSSGELRRDLGVLPPGDIRNCLSALSSDEALLSQVFQYRFHTGSGLEGHSLGNLLITAMGEITGSFEEAVAESGRVLAIYGQVLPSTLTNLQLIGEIKESPEEEIRVVRGESEITEAPGKVQKVWLEPDGALAYPPTIQAILNADLILIGPGSLYTSILPNLLVKDLTEAIQASKAETYFICNVATQRGETDGFNASDHVAVLEQHVQKQIFNLVLCNRNFKGELGQGTEWVVADKKLHENYRVYEADLVDDLYPWRHSSKKLAKAVISLYEERTGPLNY